MNKLSCNIKKLLRELDVLDNYDVERLVIEHLQRNLNTLDELQQSYQRHYSAIIQTLLQQLAQLPQLRHETIQKRVAFLQKLVTQSPTLNDLETLQQGLRELHVLLGPLPASVAPSEQIIGDLPVGPHLVPQVEAATPTQAACEKIQSIQQNNDYFAEAVEKILEIIEKLKPGAQMELIQHALKEQAQQLLQGQRQLALQLAQLQQQLASTQTQNERLTQELQHARTLSLTDELTGLPNRRAFLQRLEEEIGRVQRHPSPLTLAIVDIDHFKQINDSHGHEVGDAVLRAYAQYIHSGFRRHDHVARFGGEEFIILLPSTNIIGAVKALTKIQERVSGHTIQTESGTVSLPSFSAGVTSYHPKESSADFIRRADQALYRAKQSGRNRIETLD
ncbi:MAG: GGDEF domain-containing protein [Methylohalobius sp.]